MKFDPARSPDGTKKRRHHNNKGAVQIRTDRVFTQVKDMADRLGIPYVPRVANQDEIESAPPKST